MSFSLNKRLAVILIGPSGAGLTSSIHSFEDLGFRCVDNLPLHLLPYVLDDFLTHLQKKNFAFAVRFEELEEIKNFDFVMTLLKEKVELDIVFLSCSSEVLSKRFTTNRRKHAYFNHQKDLFSAIEEEKKILFHLMEKANACFDTTDLSPSVLKALIENRYSLDALERRKISVKITSFGFKYSTPLFLDALYDVRFLINPYFHNALREKTGKDEAVKEYMMAHKLTAPYLDKLFEWHVWLLPEHHREGRHYFNIGIGCTGGQHRSVFIAEALFLHLHKHLHQLAHISLEHRDMKE